MKRLSPEGAKKIHSAVNLAYWSGLRGWYPDPDSRAVVLAYKAYRAIPGDRYMFAKNLFYNNGVIAVSGESIVAHAGDDKHVNKHMFRYPAGSTISEFEANVKREIGIVTRCLSGIALPTSVSVMSADIFNHGLGPVDAVTQTQRYLDLGVNKDFSVESASEVSDLRARDDLACNLEDLLIGANNLRTNEGLVPDLGPNSGNLRFDPLTGDLTLIDVMPAYVGGSRLIGDSASIEPGTMQTLYEVEQFVGQFGRD